MSGALQARAAFHIPIDPRSHQAVLLRERLAVQRDWSGLYAAKDGRDRSRGTTGAYWNGLEIDYDDFPPLLRPSPESLT